MTEPTVPPRSLRNGPLLAALALSAMVHVAFVVPLALPEAVTSPPAGSVLQATLQPAPASSKTQTVVPPAAPTQPAETTHNNKIDSSVLPSPPTPVASTQVPPPAALSPSPAAGTSTERIENLATLYEDDLNVRELLPDQLGGPVVLDTEVDWRDAYRLRIRPLARGELVVTLQRDPLANDEIQPVILELKIREDGTLAKVEALYTDSPFARACVEAMQRLSFTPGATVSGPVPSVMYLEFELRRPPP